VKKILQLTTDLEIGGRERVIVDLCNYLYQAGYDTLICCIKNTGLLEANLDKNIKVYALNKKNKLDLDLIKPLKEIIKNNNIDIIHAHNPGTLLYGVIAGKLCGIDTIINTEHGFAEKIKYKTRIKDKILYKFVDVITSVSNKLESDLISMYNIKKNKIKTIRNGIFYEKICEEKIESRNKVGMNDDEYHIGIVARLTDVKNHRMIIDAFNRIRRYHRARLWIIGTGDLEKELKEYVLNLGIKNKINFTGKRTDVIRLMNAMDLFVLCSKSEGLSITLLEAMASGLPIIATNVGGNGELIKNGYNGILVELGDTKGLADAIEKMIKEKQLAMKYGMNSKINFSKYYSVETMAKEMIRLYEKIEF
jgi:L-malate glycosyltransferase